MTSQKSPWREAVIYQIYPWTFNEDKIRTPRGHGSLQGVIDRLDYLKELGVDALWLSPFYASPMVDGGYDISDYMAIHPDFGTMQDFVELVTGCHERGMRIMIDYIPNHSSNKHAWFEKSRHRERGFEEWYIWHPGRRTESGERLPPNNWASVFSASNRKARDRGEMPWLNEGDFTPYKSAWTFDDVRGEYYLHSFAAEQPDLNWSNPFVREAMKEILRYWIRLGVDGFRVDAVNYIGKNMTFPDEAVNKTYSEALFRNPFDQLLRQHSSGYPDALHQYVWEICQVLKEEEFVGRDLRMILEAYMDEAPLRYLDSIAPDIATTFNFGAMGLDWNAVHHKLQADTYYAGLVRSAVGNQVNGNHDRQRLASRLGDERARTAAVLNIFLPGMRFIYNGEELGLHNAAISDDKIIDHHEYRDGERTPMIWDDTEPNAGFSNAAPEKLWLPTNRDDYELAASRQMRNPASSLALYTAALRQCKALSAIQNGVYVPLQADSEQVFVYARHSEQETVVVIVNFSSEPQHVRVSGIQLKSAIKLLSSETIGQFEREQIDMRQPLFLLANEALVVKLTD